MNKLFWLSPFLAWQPNTTFMEWSNISNSEKEIFDVFSENEKIDEKTYHTTSDEIIEALQNSIKQQIIEWTLDYFENDVTFKLTDDEKKKLRKDISNYLNKYSNIIKIEWNNIILNLDEKNFKELFKVLLPYLLIGQELKKYSFLINNTVNLSLNKILGHIEKSTWADAEKYFFHQFWYLIMRIVEQLPWNMTIWYYKEQMLKVLPNGYILIKDYSNISNLSITELPKYF